MTEQWRNGAILDHLKPDYFNNRSDVCYHVQIYPDSSFVMPQVLLWHIFVLIQVPALCSSKYAGLRGPQKFQGFLPALSQHTLWAQNEQDCADSLSAYVQEWGKYDSANQLDSLCVHHQECILQNMSESQKSFMASSALVLGLSPIILSTLGPTVSEIGLISLNRPFLSLLLTLGTVGVYPSRILSYEDDSPLDIAREPSLFPKWALRRLCTGRWATSLVVCVQYVIVSIAVFNVCYTSWQLGVATVLNFICQSSYMPIVWTALPFFVHLPAALALRANIPSKSLRSALAWEFKLSAFHKPVDASTLTPNPNLLLWRGFATVFSLVHMTVGIVIFSSLLFTMTVDAALILLRYVASALVCRLIIMFDIYGFRLSHEQVDLSVRRA